MAEYWKKEDVLKAMSDLRIDTIDPKVDYAFCRFQEIVSKYLASMLPAADVVERKKGEWISIESKLPPEGEECLIYDGDEIYVWELRKDWQTNELVFEDKYGYDQDMEEVEYWMPLPEPPKEAKDG